MTLNDVLAYHTNRAKRHAKDLLRIRQTKHIYTGAERYTWYSIHKDYLKKLHTHNTLKRAVKEALHERLQ